MNQRIPRYVLALAYGTIAWTASPEPVKAHLGYCSTYEGQCDIIQGRFFINYEEAWCEHFKWHAPYECWYPDYMTEGSSIVYEGNCNTQDFCP